MQVHLAKQQIELLLGEIDVDGRQGERVKGEVPGGEPGIFPLVRHREDVIAYHVEPLVIANLMGRRPHRVGAVLFEPFVGIVEEVLLTPQHPGQCLPHHIGGVFADLGRRYRLIKRIGVTSTLIDDLIELRAEWVARAGVA